MSVLLEILKMWFSDTLVILVRVLVGASPRWVNTTPALTQRIYFANHTSHIDTIAIWSALPKPMRSKTRPVAAQDYWGMGRLRRFIAIDTLNAVLISRNREESSDPLEPLSHALSQGDSLIIFPEGTRRPQRLPGDFKSGLFHLSQKFPDVELIPVYLENLHRIMPKGSKLPVPLVCTIRFGAPLTRIEGEGKNDFLIRARASVEELA
jgi:1-acyl-sn-glycerol-3-phosphate acyltransferase